MTGSDQGKWTKVARAMDAGKDDGYPTGPAHNALADLKADVERLREIERVFNEGYRPGINAYSARLRLRAVHELRNLIPVASAEERS